MKNPAPVTLLVSSTDKFQGQEADIVIISLVQSMDMVSLIVQIE